MGWTMETRYGSPVWAALEAAAEVSELPAVFSSFSAAVLFSAAALGASAPEVSASEADVWLQAERERQGIRLLIKERYFFSRSDPPDFNFVRCYCGQ